MPELISLRDYLASRGTAPPQGVVARPSAGTAIADAGPDDADRARQALSTGGSTASLIARILNDPTFATIGRGAGGAAQLARIPGILDSARTDLSKATGVAGAVTGAASQFSRIPAVARALPAATSALNSGVSIGTNAAGGAATVPYLGAIASGLNIADIAQSNRPDDQKIYDSVHQVGRLVADAYLPVVGGFMADAVSGVARSLIFDDPYSQTRKEDAAKVGPAMQALLASIDTATTLDELDAAASITAAGARGEVGGRGVALRGVHLDTSGQETALSDAYNARKTLIKAATANPNGAEAQQLAQVRGRVGPLRSAADVVSRALNNGFQTGSPSSAQILAASVVPPEMSIDVITNDLGVQVLKHLDERTTNLERFRAEDQGRTPMTAPHVASQVRDIRELVSAAQTLNLDLDAARKRLDATRLEEQQQQDNASRSAGDGGDGGGAGDGGGGGGSGDG